jgi:hypothetical protein
MKTHDVARALNTLARALRDGGNVTLESISIHTDKIEKSSPPALGDNAPAALALLVRLAGYSKDEWRTLIKELELDVPIKTTDSVRDILGRLLKYLNDNKDVQEKLVENAKKPTANVSPELMKALSILMNK